MQDEFCIIIDENFTTVDVRNISGIDINVDALYIVIRCGTYGRDVLRFSSITDFTRFTDKLSKRWDYLLYEQSRN